MKPLQLIQFYDSSLVIKLFSARHYHSILPVARLVSRLGDGHFYLVAGLLSWLIQGWDYGLFAALLLVFAIERPVYYLLKNTLRRNRPFCVLAIESQVKPSDRFSFPSGHTSAAFAFAIVCMQFFPLLSLPLLLLAAAIGFSRIVLGVHYPTDILMGVLLGIVIAYFSLSL